MTDYDKNFSNTVNLNNTWDMSGYGSKFDVTLDDIKFPWDKESSKLWRDCLPSLLEVEKMCEQYPALEKAYENFKTVYALVEQDWKGNHDDDEFDI